MIKMYETQDIFQYFTYMQLESLNDVCLWGRQKLIIMSTYKIKKITVWNIYIEQTKRLKTKHAILERKVKFVNRRIQILFFNIARDVQKDKW